MNIEMTAFTKEQAFKIIDNNKHLIGQPFDNQLTITSLTIIPIDQDLDFIFGQYNAEGTTCQSIGEKFGKGKNLSVQVLSTNMFRLNRSVIRADIAEYLSAGELDDILKNH
jgi:hypothetical protein